MDSFFLYNAKGVYLEQQGETVSTPNYSRSPQKIHYQ